MCVERVQKIRQRKAARDQSPEASILRPAFQQMEKLIEDGIRIAQSEDNLQELNKDFAEEQ